MKPIICATKEQKENAYARRVIMQKHEILSELIYNMIWMFLIGTIIKSDYKIKSKKLGKLYPNHFC